MPALPAPQNGSSVAPPASASLRDQMLTGGLDARRARALGEALESEHRLLDAVEAFTVANRLQRDPALERRLVRLRRAAYGQVDTALAPAVWPHFAVPAVTGRADGPLEIRAHEFDATALKTGVLRHGHLLVRGLVPAAQVARLRDATDRAFAARQAIDATGPTPDTAAWYDPLDAVPDGDTDRSVVRTLQGLFTADSPRALFEFFEIVQGLGLTRLVESYFGERPAVSLKKCTLRRIDREVRLSGWHQDGAFLGQGIRSLNMWTAVSACGRDTPGIEVMPVRLDRMVSQLDDGGPFAWTVPPEHIARELPGATVWAPEFEPGDVLFFDHWSLHRTAVFEGTPARARYAIESWFFAPSAYERDAAELLIL